MPLSVSLQGLLLDLQRHAPGRQTHAGVLLRDLQALARRVITIQRHDPFSQRCKRGELVIRTDPQLLKTGKAVLLGLNQGLPFAFHIGIGLFAPIRCSFGRLPRFVVPRLALRMQGFEARNPCGVGMRFQIAPCGQLGERGVDVLDPRRHAGPSGLAQDFVGPQLQAVLPFSHGKHFHDAAIKVGLLSTYMPEKFG